MHLSDIFQTRNFWKCLDFKPGDKVVHFWAGERFEDEIMEVSHLKGKVWFKGGGSRWIERVQRIKE